MQRVTSRNNPRLREAARLIASSRDRRKAGRCVLEGEHLVDVYQARGGLPECLLIVEEMRDTPRLAALASRMPPADVLYVPAAMFTEFSTLPPAIGVLAVIQTPVTSLPAPTAFHLLLDDLQDPGNVGTILRTAAAAGVEQVLLSRDCAFAWSPKVLRAGQGAHFLTTIVEDVDLGGWADRFRTQGGQVVGTAPVAGTDLFAASLRWPLAIIVGNEGAGIAPALFERVDVRVTIPMPGGMESLNASAAAAVVLFEAVRQRRNAYLRTADQ